VTRIGILGTKRDAAMHLAAWQRVDEVESAFPLSTEYAACINPAEWRKFDNIGVVDICLPLSMAAEPAIAAAHAGKQIVMEYLPGTEEQAKKLIEACADAGTSLLLLKPWRHQSLSVDLAEALNEGKLGTLHFAHGASIWCWDQVEQEERLSLATDPSEISSEEFLVDHATAMVDFLSSLFPKQVVRVFARTTPLQDSTDLSHYASIVLMMADASQAICEVGRTTSLLSGTGLLRVTLTGRAGSAYADLRHGDWIVDPTGLRPLIDDPSVGLDVPIQKWARASNQQFTSNVDEGWKTHRIMRAAIESLRTGQPAEVA
jgi:predicted dehydrogenase